MTQDTVYKIVLTLRTEMMNKLMEGNDNLTTKTVNFEGATYFLKMEWINCDCIYVVTNKETQEKMIFVDNYGGGRSAFVNSRQEAIELSRENEEWE